MFAGADNQHRAGRGPAATLRVQTDALSAADLTLTAPLPAPQSAPRRRVPDRQAIPWSEAEFDQKRSAVTHRGTHRNGRARGYAGRSRAGDAQRGERRITPVSVARK